MADRLPGLNISDTEPPDRSASSARSDRAADEEEIPLSGGFSNVVSRRGATVRRNTGPWTPAVHALLRHFRAVGFELAPEPLGIDEHGREILGHLDGETAWWPWPAALQTDDGLRQVAGALRAMQAALATFDEPPDAVWADGPRTDPDHVLRHGDLGPWNTLWSGDRLTGLIDWDTTGPAPAGWDAAQGAWYFVPLRARTGYRATGPGPSVADQGHRLAVWCAELGWEPDHLLDLVDRVQRFERDRVRTRGSAGIEPWASFLARGDADEIDAERAWLDAHRTALLRPDEPGSDASASPL